MTPPLHIIWNGPNGELHSYSLASGLWQDNPLTYGVSFPGDDTTPQRVTLTGSGLRRRSYDILTNVTLRLDGDAATLAAIASWISVSFDDGATFTALTTDPLPLPAAAMGPQGIDGQIGPFDVAGFLVRATIPTAFTQYQALDFRIAVDCDVV